METWMTKEELLEGMMHWQKIALANKKKLMKAEDYIDELEITINMMIMEMEEV